MKKLGIVGGLGPAASSYFYELLTRLTPAEQDQQHLDITLLSRPSIPDRTAYILGRSTASPVPQIIQALRDLQRLQVDLIAIPCITAHYFFDELQASTPIPIVNILEETANALAAAGVKAAGIMATEATAKTGILQRELEKRNIRAVVPDEKTQQAITDVIYTIKANRPPCMADFYAAADALKAAGAQRMVLSCTELSLIKRDAGLDDTFVDAMELLARRCIHLCMGQAVLPAPSSRVTYPHRRVVFHRINRCHRYRSRRCRHTTAYPVDFILKRRYKTL